MSEKSNRVGTVLGVKDVLHRLLASTSQLADPLHSVLLDFQSAKTFKSCLERICMQKMTCAGKVTHSAAQSSEHSSVVGCLPDAMAQGADLQTQRAVPELSPALASPLPPHLGASGAVPHTQPGVAAPCRAHHAADTRHLAASCSPGAAQNRFGSLCL